ncbi:MAG TPA: hypothetical protein VM097_11285 [Mycobacteriales bacterium]|nr:hypothetical protein [Mycobacteriales bacterium]
MSERPGRPVGEDGKPVFPATTKDDDDVQGHRMIDPEPDEEQDDKDRPPHIAV